MPQPAPGGAPGAPSAAAAFICCTARSGSTLLRWLLDAHPELSCPSETDVAVLAANYVRIAEGLQLGSAAARAGARTAVSELLEAHLARSGKASWCDKSLSNVFHLPLLAELFPEATFICLYRHAMDMVASGLEASPWGLSDYGFSQVAAMFPTNSVGALAAYWLDRTGRMVDFAEANPERCVAVCYEELVRRPDEVANRLFERLGVAPLEGAATAAFATDHQGSGPADYRIWYTDAVRTDAVGTGASLPVEQIGEPLRSQMNAILARLGYETVDDWWGSGGGPSGGSAVEVRITERGATRARLELTPLGFATSPGAVVAIEQRALEGLASGEENPGAALRRRAVRLYGFGELTFAHERDLLAAVRELLIGHLGASR